MVFAGMVWHWNLPWRFFQTSDKFSAPCPAALRNDLPATPWRNISMQSETLLTAWNYGQLWSIDVQRIYIYTHKFN